MLIPGILTARLVAPRTPPPAGDVDLSGRLLVALGWAFGMVPTFSFFICLATTWRVSWLTLVAASVVNTALVAWRLYLRDRSWAVLLPSPSRSTWAALHQFRWLVIAAALTGLFYFLKYDTRFSGTDSCIHAAAHVAVGNVNPHIDLLRQSVEDARLGNPGVMSAFLVAFQAPGLRVLYGILGLLLALGGYLIGRSIGGRPAYGFLGMALLALNPYVASIPQLDENLLTLAFASTVLPFVVANGTGWAAAGALFGLVVLCRHVMLPALPALLYAAWRSPAGRRGVVAFAGAFVAVTLLENLHHHLALGSVLRFESNPQFPVFDYTFLGMDFRWQGVVNWPMYETLVRTPHNPFPMLVLWPLMLVDHLGVILFSVMLVGSVAIFRIAPRLGVFWVLWSAVVIAGLSVQEAWDHLNKLGVMAIVAGAFVAWMVAGVACVFRRPLLAIPVVAVLVGSLFLFLHMVHDWRPPPDPRYLSFPGVSTELPQRLELDARTYLDAGLLPDIARLDQLGSFIDLRKITGIPRDFLAPHPDLARRPWGWFPGEPPARGPAVTLELDLGRDPFSGDFIRVTDAPPDLDLSATQGLIRVRGADVEWALGRVNVYAGVGPLVTALVLYLGDEPVGSSDAQRELRQTHHWKAVLWERRKIWSMMAGFVLSADDPGAWSDLDAAILRIRVPSGGLSIGLEKNLRGARVYHWKGIVGSHGVSTSGPVDLWHN
jgi:hypothetical protein